MNDDVANKYIAMNNAKFHERVHFPPIEGCGPCVKLRVKREYASRCRLLIRKVTSNHAVVISKKKREIIHLIDRNQRTILKFLTRGFNFQSH